METRSWLCSERRACRVFISRLSSSSKTTMQSTRVDRSQRQRKPKQIFTPETGCPSGHYHLVFQQSTGLFNIIERKYILSVKNGLATVIKHGVRTQGLIQCSGIVHSAVIKDFSWLFLCPGSHQQCEAERKKLIRIYSEQQRNEEKENEDGTLFLHHTWSQAIRFSYVGPWASVRRRRAAPRIHV